MVCKSYVCVFYILSIYYAGDNPTLLPGTHISNFTKLPSLSAVTSSMTSSFSVAILPGQSAVIVQCYRHTEGNDDLSCQFKLCVHKM